MMLGIDLSDRFANYSVSQERRAHYYGIIQADKFDDQCLFSFDCETQNVVFDPSGVAVNFMTGFYAEEQNIRPIILEGVEISPIVFIECVLERILATINVRITKVYMLVPFMCSEMKKRQLRQLFADREIMEVDFIPYCVAEALNYVADQHLLFKNSERPTTFLLFNAEYTYCDCAVFELEVQGNSIDISFLSAFYNDQFECEPLEDIIFNGFVESVEKKEQRTVLRLMHLYKHDITTQLYRYNLTDLLYGMNSEKALKLPDILQNASENKLQDWYNSDDIYYADEILYLGDEYLLRCAEKQESKICDIIKSELAEFEQNFKWQQIDFALGTGKVLHQYPNLTRKVNELLQEFGLASLEKLTPHERYALMGINHVGTYRLKRMQHHSLRVVNEELKINKKLVEKGKEIQLSYSNSIDVNIPNYLREYKIIVKEGNICRIYLFEEPYHLMNLNISLQIELYSFVQRYILFANVGTTMQEAKQVAEALRGETTFQLVDSKELYLEVLLEAIFNAGNIFDSHYNQTLRYSPHNLMHYVTLVDAVIQQPENELINAEQALHFKEENIDNILLAMKDVVRPSQLVISPATVYESLVKNFKENVQVLELEDAQTVDEVFQLENGGLSYHGKPLNLEFFSLLTIGSIIFTLNDGFPLFLEKESGKYGFACLELPLGALPRVSEYYFEILREGGVLDMFDDRSSFLCCTGVTGSVLLRDCMISAERLEYLQLVILETSILLPFFGSALVTFLRRKEVGIDTLVEIRSDGWNYDSTAYDVELINHQARNARSTKDSGVQPFIYNVNLELLLFIAKSYNLLTNQKAIRIAMSYGDMPLSGVIIDAQDCTIVMQNGKAYGKFFVLSKEPLNGFDPIEKLCFLKPSEAVPEAGNRVMRYGMENKYMTTLGDSGENRVYVYGINDASHECIFNFPVETLMQDISLVNQVGYAKINLDMQRATFELEEGEIRVPFIPIGQLFFEVGLEGLRSAVNTMNITTCVKSPSAPCCIEHRKRAIELIIDGEATPFYLTCPEEDCNLCFCLKCYEWHEYVDPRHRTCENVGILCPGCGLRGVLGEFDCYAVQCPFCETYFCYFPQCHRVFSSYKQCESHVFKHGKGIGKVEEGNENDLIVNKDHI